VLRKRLLELASASEGRVEVIWGLEVGDLVVTVVAPEDGPDGTRELLGILLKLGITPVEEAEVVGTALIPSDTATGQLNLR